MYASSKNNRGAWDDFNLATIVVVAVAGLLLLGNVAYYTRRWVALAASKLELDTLTSNSSVELLAYAG